MFNSELYALLLGICYLSMPDSGKTKLISGAQVRFEIDFQMDHYMKIKINIEKQMFNQENIIVNEHNFTMTRSTVKYGFYLDCN